MTSRRSVSRDSGGVNVITEAFDDIWESQAGRLNLTIEQGSYFYLLFQWLMSDATPVLLWGTSLRSTAYKWTASAHGTNEYYCDLTAGGDPSLVEPNYLVINGARATKGTVGTLVAGTWGFDDNDSLGYDTVYVRLADGTDPDTKAVDYIKYPTFTFELQIRTSAAATTSLLTLTSTSGIVIDTDPGVANRGKFSIALADTATDDLTFDTAIWQLEVDTGAAMVGKIRLLEGTVVLSKEVVKPED